MEKTPVTDTHLLLWRHAEAGPGLPDLRRGLTSRGERQARQMARWLIRHAPRQLRVLVSPATRTRQTADALHLRYEIDARLAPGAGVADLLAAAREGEAGATLVVGHQPTLGRAASFLLSGHEAEWAIKKGGVWWFSSRDRNGETQTVLRAVVSCSMLAGRHRAVTA